MIRFIAILATTLLASTTFASSADLIGKWTSPCTANQGSNNYQISTFDFQVSGALQMMGTVYTDSTCTTQQSQFAVPATYTATDKAMHVTIKDKADVTEVDADYVVAGDLITITPTAATQNGQPTGFDRSPLTFKRAN